MYSDYTSVRLGSKELNKKNETLWNVPAD